MSDDIFEFKIAHRNWSEALSLLFAILTMASTGDVVVLTGGSRCGKSRLILAVCDLLFKSGELDSNGMLPYISTTAHNEGGDGRFSTKSFTFNALEGVKHPFYVEGLANDIDLASISWKKFDGSTEPAMKIALRRAFIRRNVRFWFIDEAHHARYIDKNATGGVAVLDSWKCFAQQTGVVLVLVGAYPLLQLTKNAPHLEGRTYEVELPPYRCNEADLSEFLVIVETYALRLKSRGKDSTLRENLQLLHFGSLGCIGLLRAWLLRAFALSNIKNCAIDRDILLKTIKSDSALKVMRNEIALGELMMKSTAGEVFSNKKPAVKPDKKVIADSGDETSNEKDEEDATPPVKKGKPFQRKPARMALDGRND